MLKRNPRARLKRRSFMVIGRAPCCNSRDTTYRFTPDKHPKIASVTRTAGSTGGKARCIGLHRSRQPVEKSAAAVAMMLRIPLLFRPIFYVGRFLICTGVVQTLRRDHQA
jgi:hypothetical protein